MGDVGKNVVRHVSYGMKLDKYDDFTKWCKKNVPEIRGQPGVTNVDLAVCGTGRVGVHYEFADLDSFKAYMDSDYYAKMRDDFVKQSFYDGSKDPQTFVGFKQPPL